MPKATPGIPYTVVAGDTLSGIAKQAYGDGNQWKKIFQANSTTLKSGDPNLIFPGEIITIPANPVEEAAVLDLFADALPTLPGKDKDDFTAIIDDLEIPVMSGRAFRAADTAAAGWSAVIAVNLEDQSLVDALRPYAYTPAECYLGGQLLIRGFIYGTAPTLKEKERTNAVQGWSQTVDIIDSDTKPPYEAKNITLEKRARDLVEPLGIKVVFNVDDDEEFKRVTIGNTEKIFAHLAKLAAQRGVLITSSELGELIFTRAADSKPIGVIEEGAGLADEFTAEFDGRQRFNSYKALAQSPGRKAKSKRNSKFQIAKDDNVPKSRSLTFSTDETTAGGMKKAADWRRSKQFADALTLELPVSSWYGPDDNLWKENTIVTVKSQTLYMPDGFDLLIRSVEYIFEEKATRAVLSVVPPQVYTGEKLAEPWASAEQQAANLIDRVVGAL
jgi:prophage tail gpP-like protein